MKKKIVYLCMLSLLSVFLLAGCGNKEEKNNPNYNSDNYLSGNYYALMTVEDYGPIFLELYADQAPATVTNFVNLVNEGFYDGLTFHRIMSGFVLQGGCPEGTGAGTAEYTVPGEFATNGFDNTISHVRGTLSMARSTEDNDSASSQFFIVHEDTTGLDGYYAAFGKVISGMAIVDAIVENAVVEDENGTVLAANQPVITSITMLEKEEAVFDNTEEVEVIEPELPDPEAIISLVKIDSAEGMQFEDRWVVNEDGGLYFLTSSADLLSLALYETDLTQGMPYDKENPLAYSSDIGAGSFISMQITVSPTDLNLLLIAEEHNGALGMYLLSYDVTTESAYLVPVIN